MKYVAFVNHKSGVGKTTLVYHLAWMFAEMGLNVVAADLDPQSGLTCMFLDEDRSGELWPAGEHPLTIQGAVDPVLNGTGDIQITHVEAIDGRIGLVPGDLGLSGLEDRFSEAWSMCENPSEPAFRVITAFYTAVRLAAQQRGADIVLVDTGASLGAISRSALIGAQSVIIPLASDLFAWQALRMLGPRLRAWRATSHALQRGEMTPLGYVLTPRIRRPGSSALEQRCMARITTAYSEFVSSEPDVADLHANDLYATNDPHRLASLRNYRSLMPLAIEARKPMFLLKPADGAIGAHGEAVRDCYRDFKALAERILYSIV